MRRLAVWLWATLIVLLSLLPPGLVAAPPAWLRGVPGLDKLGHAALYGMLALLELWSGGGETPRHRWRRAAGVVGLCLLFGLFMEGMQGLAGYRSADWLDGVADLAGAAVGALAGTLARGPRRGRRAAA